MKFEFPFQRCADPNRVANVYDLGRIVYTDPSADIDPLDGRGSEEFGGNRGIAYFG
jgi:hypothetical protein